MLTHHNHNNTHKATTLKFVGNSGNVEHVVTGSEDGSVRVWDPSASPRAVCEHEGGGVVRLVVQEHLVFVCYTDGCSCVWDARTGECVATLTGHTDSVLDIAVSPDGRLVLTASDDHTCRVFAVPH